MRKKNGVFCGTIATFQLKHSIGYLHLILEVCCKGMGKFQLLKIFNNSLVFRIAVFAIYGEQYGTDHSAG